MAGNLSLSRIKVGDEDFARVKAFLEAGNSSINGIFKLVKKIFESG
jgi:hypothetical protein